MIIAGDGLPLPQLNIIIWCVPSDLWTVRANRCLRAPPPVPAFQEKTLQSLPNRCAVNQRVWRAKRRPFLGGGKRSKLLFMLKKKEFKTILIRRKIYFKDECGPLINYATNTFPLEVPRSPFAWIDAALSFFNGWKNPLKKELCIGGGWAGVNYSAVISALRCAAGGTVYRTVSSVLLKTGFWDSLGKAFGQDKNAKMSIQ